MVDFADVDAGVGTDSGILLLVAIQSGIGSESTLIGFTTTESAIASDIATLLANIVGSETATGIEVINSILGNELGHGSDLGRLVLQARELGFASEVFEFQSVPGSLSISIQALGTVELLS